MQGPEIYVRKPRREAAVIIRRALGGIVLGFIVCGLLTEYVVQPMRVVSDTMKPSIQKGAMVFTLRSAYGIRLPLFHSKETGRTILFGRPRTGDVVLISDPSKPDPNIFQRLLSFPVYAATLGSVDLAPKHFIIKRVVAGPSDKVAVRFKRIYVNDVLLKETWPTLNSDSRILPASVSPRDEIASFVVPYGCYYLLGDNRDYSYDSRDFGPVPFAHIEGKVITR